MVVLRLFVGLDDGNNDGSNNDEDENHNPEAYPALFASSLSGIARFGSFQLSTGRVNQCPWDSVVYSKRNTHPFST